MGTRLNTPAIALHHPLLHLHEGAGGSCHPLRLHRRRGGRRSMQPPPTPVSARGDGRQALQQRAQLLARQKELEELQLQLEQECTALERELSRRADGGPTCAHAGEVNRKLTAN